MCSVNCAVFSVQFVVCNVQCVLGSVKCELGSVQCGVWERFHVTHIMNGPAPLGKL